MSLDDIKWLNLQDAIDERGRLTAVEGGVHVPFPIARVFFVHQVVPGVDRGGHAHRDTDQVAIAVHGSLKIDLSDGVRVQTYSFDHPERGLYIPRMIYTRLYNFSDEAVCLVLASMHYDRSRSIRSWQEFLRVRALPWRQEPGA